MFYARGKYRKEEEYKIKVIKLLATVGFKFIKPDDFQQPPARCWPQAHSERKIGFHKRVRVWHITADRRRANDRVQRIHVKVELYSPFFLYSSQHIRKMLVEAALSIPMPPAKTGGVKEAKTISQAYSVTVLTFLCLLMSSVQCWNGGVAVSLDVFG